MSEKRLSGNQIVKKYANDTFVEVISPTDDFDMVKMNFIKFNKQTSKQEYMIPIYFDIPSMLNLCNKIKLGMVTNLCENEKRRMQQNGDRYPRAIMPEKPGGTPAKKNNGQAVARIFTMTPATASKYANVMLIAETGKGIEDDRGLIRLNRKDTKNDPLYKKIQVPMSYDDLYELALITEMRINAIINHRYTTGYYYYNYIPSTSSAQEEQTGHAVDLNAYRQQNAKPQQNLVQQPVQQMYTSQHPQVPQQYQAQPVQQQYADYYTA